MRIQIITLAALLMSVAVVNSSPAQSIGLRGAGGQIGFTDMGLGNAFTFGAHADLGEFSPNLRFQPSISYWKKSYSVWYSASLSMLRINGDVKYLFPLGGSFTPYAGGGLAYARGTVGGDFGAVSASEIQINLIGGAEAQLKPGLRGFGELRIENSTTHIAFGVTMPMGN